MRFYAPLFDPYPQIWHGFFGVSHPCLRKHEKGSLNESAFALISEKSMQSLFPSEHKPIYLNQVHGIKVHDVNQTWLSAYSLENIPEGDGLITMLPDVPLAVLSADCAPLLWFEPKAHLVGASHAGWRGALGGIVEAMVEAIEKKGGDRKELLVALGPMIQNVDYTVGEDMYASFMKVSTHYHRFFQRRSDRLTFDLPHFVKYKLERLGVKAFYDLACNTMHPLFFSHRQLLKEGYESYQRNLSVVTLRNFPLAQGF